MNAMSEQSTVERCEAQANDTSLPIPPSITSAMNTRLSRIMRYIAGRFEDLSADDATYGYPNVFTDLMTEFSELSEQMERLEEDYTSVKCDKASLVKNVINAALEEDQDKYESGYVSSSDESDTSTETDSEESTESDDTSSEEHEYVFSYERDIDRSACEKTSAAKCAFGATQTDPQTSGEVQVKDT